MRNVEQTPDRTRPGTRVNAVPCRDCGAELLWIEGIRRPVEADPVPYADGATGVVWDRQQHRIRYSHEVWPEPQFHHAHHRCQAWDRRQLRRMRVDFAGVTR